MDSFDSALVGPSVKGLCHEIRSITYGSGKTEQRLRHEGTGTADMSLGAVALGSAQRRGWRRASARRHARMGDRSGLSKQSVAQRTTRGTALGRRECAASTVRLPAKA